MSFSLLSLFACKPEPEAGINRTDIYGHVTITPQTVEEQPEGAEDSEELDNDSLEGAQSIESLSYRRVVFNGSCDEYRTAGLVGPPAVIWTTSILSLRLLAALHLSCGTARLCLPMKV